VAGSDTGKRGTMACMPKREAHRNKSLPVSTLALGTALVQRLVEALVYGLVDALVQRNKWSSPSASKRPFLRQLGRESAWQHRLIRPEAGVEKIGSMF